MVGVLIVQKKGRAVEEYGGVNSNKKRKDEIAAAREFRYELATLPSFPPFYGCRLDIVPKDSNRSSVDVIPCRVCQVSADNCSVVARSAAGKQYEVAWVQVSAEDAERHSAAAPPVTAEENISLQPNAPPRKEISSLLFSDSDSASEGEGGDCTAGMSESSAPGADVSDSLGQIWSLLDSCGVEESHTRLHEETAAADNQPEVEAVKDAEEYFERVRAAGIVHVYIANKESPEIIQSNSSTGLTSM